MLKVCKEINNSKSASILNIKTFVLKDALLGNIERATKMFNSSLFLSIFPKAWKLSTIVPLPKVPHPRSPSDLRPVALTPLPGKLMVKLIRGRIQGWLSDNEILSIAQHGFRKKKSTISAIASFLDTIYNDINNKIDPWTIYLDLDTLPITYGVPQGSILGPILFSIYINEIANIVNCGIVLYTDDTVIFHQDKNILQDNLRIITDWCNNNLLTINVEKSHWMHTIGSVVK